MKLWLLSLLAIFLSLTIVKLASGSLVPTVSSAGQKPLDLSELTGDYDTTAQWGIYNNKQFPLPKNLAVLNEPSDVLGVTSSFENIINPVTEKKIMVDLTHQHIFAFEGNTQVYDFPVSTGKWHPTPTGTFHIWIKLRSTRMQGGSKALGTYYNLPNVPYTMYLYNDEYPKTDGYGIHGAYWHNNFGHPMSHGCINMRTEDVAKLYYWANPNLDGKPSILATEDNPGTEVVIYGTTPKE
jgi:lipoprotein-anchoring transpeptidase ErfK/SrfK